MTQRETYGVHGVGLANSQTAKLRLRESFVLEYSELFQVYRERVSYVIRFSHHSRGMAEHSFGWKYGILGKHRDSR